MKTINTAIRLIAVQLGLSTSVALGADPVAGREGHPMTRSRLPRWAAVLTLAIALAPAAASAQEDGTITISSTFYMDSLSGTVGSDLAEVFANGHEHTWTLTLYGTSQSHETFTNPFGVTSYATEIHATSFNLEFFGPDAATLNGIVSEHIAGGDVLIYLDNEYSSGIGDDFAIMYVEPTGPDFQFFSEIDTFGSATLFPSDADGYPVVGPDPFSIWAEYSALSDIRPGNNGYVQSRASLVTFAAPAIPPPPSLTIRRIDSTTVAVSWPASASNFVLQQNTNSVSSINWSNITSGIQNDGTTKTLVINPASGSRFYRLVIP
jgi:hypothetical protein